MTGGKFPGEHFLVCMNGRVSAAGFPERGSKHPFSPHTRDPLTPGCTLPGGSQHRIPYKLVLCSDRPRTGFGGELGGPWFSLGKRLQYLSVPGPPAEPHVKIFPGFAYLARALALSGSASE